MRLDIWHYYEKVYQKSNISFQLYLCYNHSIKNRNEENMFKK